MRQTLVTDFEFWDRHRALMPPCGSNDHNSVSLAVSELSGLVDHVRSLLRNQNQIEIRSDFAGAELRGRLEQAADRADARRHPFHGRRARAEDDEVGAHSALVEGQQASILHDQRAVEDFRTKPAFRDAWKWGQRCLVVTDGFYEWKKLDPKGKEKQPYAIAMADNAPMVMAGLWAKWKSPEGEQVLSCTILTCGPNGAMGELHDRMPVIVDEADWPKWLGETPATEDELMALLKPSPDASLKIWPVGKMVGNVRNNGPPPGAASVGRQRTQRWSYVGRGAGRESSVSLQA